MAITITTEQEVFRRLAEDITANLQARGVPVPDVALTNVSEALLLAFRLAHRTVHPHPRRVRYSQELAGRDLPESLQSGLRRVVDELEQGRDVTQRLTRRFLKPRFNDSLFNDLAIQHLHVGERDRVSGDVDGARDVLFAIVLEEEVLLLDIADHTAFQGSYDFVAVLERNWPELLRQDRLDGIVDGEASVTLSAKDRATYRKVGANLPLVLPEGVFLPPGGLVTRDGTSLRAIQNVQQTIGKLRNYLQLVVSDSPKLVSAIAARTGVSTNALDLRVVFAEDGDLAFLELTTGVMIEPAQGIFHVLPRRVRPAQRPEHNQ